MRISCANGMREDNVLGQWTGFGIGFLFGEEEALRTTLALDFRPSRMGEKPNRKK